MNLCDKVKAKPSTDLFYFDMPYIRVDIIRKDKDGSCYFQGFYQNKTQSRTTDWLPIEDYEVV